MFHITWIENSTGEFGFVENVDNEPIEFDEWAVKQELAAMRKLSGGFKFHSVDISVESE